MPHETKILLAESEIPTHWTNLMPDLPGAPAPPLRPDTLEPAGPDDLSPIFPMGLIQQEVSADPETEIPDEVRDIYKLWRPTPLLRARRLERALDTPAHLYYKYEGTSPAGSHAMKRVFFPSRKVARTNGIAIPAKLEPPPTHPITVSGYSPAFSIWARDSWPITVW